MIDPMTLQDCKVKIAQGIAMIVQLHYKGDREDLVAFIAEEIELDPIIDYYEKVESKTGSISESITSLQQSAKAINAIHSQSLLRTQGIIMAYNEIVAIRNDIYKKAGFTSPPLEKLAISENQSDGG